MNKLIILTASIIRGEFHKKTIGKFYDFFSSYLKNYEIYHIINIDEPANLKKHFNNYETMNYYNQMIPKNVKTIFINKPNPGFLNAYKKLMTKVEEMKLLHDDYLYYWLEDDWEPKQKYNISFFLQSLNFKNSAYSFSNQAPLGSFRGGPFMTGSYFKNVFNIKKYMNDTCDPERQMQRWVRGANNKNNNSFIHRLAVKNDNIELKHVHLILVAPKNSKIDLLNNLCVWIYKSPPYDKSISFHYHLLCYDNNYNLEYSSYNNNSYKLKPITKIELQKIFNTLSIKYFVVQPVIFNDEWLGRKFNEKYKCVKWVNAEDGTTYSSLNLYDAQLGNWKLMNEDNLRYKPEITMNKGFFSALAYIHMCLPYLEKEYFNKDIKLNLLYYSHNYGNYPNFQVIGNLLQLNYEPTVNRKNKQFEELTCLAGLSRKIEDKQEYKYKNDFKSANSYFSKYLKFDKSIYDEVERFVTQFRRKKKIGIHYRGTDKNKVKWVTHISMDEFIKIVDYQLKQQDYDIIFISSDESRFIDVMKNKYGKQYQVLFYDKEKNEENNNSIHLNRLSLMENKVRELKALMKDKDNNMCKIVVLEDNLKKETQHNETLLKNVIVNSLLLSKCNYVLKTHSQVSAYSKVFNPNLEIYRVNACQESYWPDSHIPLYDYQNVKDKVVKALLENKLKNECKKN